MKQTNKLTGCSVIVKNDNIEGALSKFKSNVYNSGKLKEVYDRKFFTKPSLVKRKEKLKAIYIQKLRDLEDK